MLNKAILMGRLTAAPELRSTPNGISVVSFTLAVDRSYSSKGGEKQTDFIDIVAWRQTAEFVNRYFTKGMQVAVSGPIQSRKWTDKNGQNRTAVEVVADEVYFADSKKKDNLVPDDHGRAAAENAYNTLSGKTIEVKFDDLDEEEELPF